MFKLSHPRYHTRNLDIIINILLTNGYSLKFIFDIASKRLRPLIILSSREITSFSHNDSSDINNISHVPSHMFKVFRFFHNSVHLQSFLTLISDITKDLNLNLTYVVKNKLNIFIKLHKDS